VIVSALLTTHATLLAALTPDTTGASIKAEWRGQRNTHFNCAKDPDRNLQYQPSYLLLYLD